MLRTLNLHLPEPHTALYPLLRHRVSQTAQPIAERLQAWGMMPSRRQLDTTRSDGRPVSYGDIEFEGSPRTVFWSDFFEPFLLAATRQSVEWFLDHCRERHLDPGIYLAELRSLLGILVDSVYQDMASIDQVLRGAGYPDSATPVVVTERSRRCRQKSRI
jgi:hypothetical protein